jgi:CubicO group peptidase (beta-lactamase class C family)
MDVEGFCDPRFGGVREEFERNFRERGEVGASVCVVAGGRAVVDLWGGLADRLAGRPWRRDTIGLVWSCTKGAAALCAHVLVSRGLLELDAPVARYWPAFGQAGKEHVTVRMALNHQAGVPVLRRPLRPGGLYDWDYFAAAVAAAEPFWEPPTRQGYHALTFGHIVGELVRRTDGRPFDVFFREEVTGPLGLDFHIGLPPSQRHRVAPTTRADPAPPGEPPSRFLLAAQADPGGMQGLMLRNTGRRAAVGDHDSAEAHTAVLPSGGGITNARGLAGMYAPLSLGGEAGAVRLVDGDTLAQMAAVGSATAVDAVLLIGLRVALGFWKSSDNRGAPPGARDGMVLSEAAFGHPGMGGSLGFADPVAQVAFGYTMNKQGRGVGLNDRGQSLADALYRALGCRSDRSGRWV